MKQSSKELRIKFSQEQLDVINYIYNELVKMPKVGEISRNEFIRMAVLSGAYSIYNKNKG